MPIFDFMCKRCGVEQELLIVGASEFPRCCKNYMHKLPSSFAFKLPGKHNPKNLVEMNNIMKDYGDCPVFESPEHQEKAEWSLKKSRMGDDHLTI
ncbi:MAG: hypothetical protein ACW99G_14435 [Candidatus Thorarchaeota archaeon]|jgi:hypothetical protein